MPTYDYECKSCGVFEHFQSISSPKLDTCPHCASKNISRLMGTGGGLVLKGSGWYVTDFKNKSGGSKSPSSSESPPKSPSTPKE